MNKILYYNNPINFTERMNFSEVTFREFYKSLKETNKINFTQNVFLE